MKDNFCDLFKVVFLQFDDKLYVNNEEVGDFMVDWSEMK